METNSLFRGMPLTCLITNFSEAGGFERIYLATGCKPGSTTGNAFRKSPEKENRQHSWNGRPMRA